MATLYTLPPPMHQHPISQSSIYCQPTMNQPSMHHSALHQLPMNQQSMQQHPNNQQTNNFHSLLERNRNRDNLRSPSSGTSVISNDDCETKMSSSEILIFSA